MKRIRLALLGGVVLGSTVACSAAMHDFLGQQRRGAEMLAIALALLTGLILGDGRLTLDRSRGAFLASLPFVCGAVLAVAAGMAAFGLGSGAIPCGKALVESARMPLGVAAFAGYCASLALMASLQIVYSSEPSQRRVNFRT